jgi:tyrosine-protein phosphatase SIW14
MPALFRQPIFSRVVIFLALVLSTQAGAQNEGPQPSDPHAIATHLKLRGVPNFGRVNANIYRGGQPTEAGLANLKKMGIDIVVNLRQGQNEIEEKMADKLGMHYISIPSRCEFPQDEPLAEFLEVIEKNPSRKVFVHCRLGADRTGIAVASYRMADQGWSPQEAQREMNAFGFTRMHRAFCPGLTRYEESFPQRLKTSPAFRPLISHSNPAPQ